VELKLGATVQYPTHNSTTIVTTSTLPTLPYLTNATRKPVNLEPENLGVTGLSEDG
jgi:hypothetical protein